MMVSTAALSQPSRLERSDPTAEEIAKMQALTPADFERTAKVEDDDLATRVQIVTADGYIDKGPSGALVTSDNFLRAFIDKKTGAVRYQVYETVEYRREWRQFYSVNYAMPTGPVVADAREVAHDILSCRYGCSFEDHLIFDVTEDVLRQVASQYVPGNSPFWRFRFNAKNGINWEDRMLPAEAAGLLTKVDAYRAAHKQGSPGLQSPSNPQKRP